MVVMLRTILPTVLLFISFIPQATDSAAQYPVDTDHSTIGFSVSILGGLSKVTGKFTNFTVTLKHDQNDITKSSVNVVIKAASIYTGVTERDNHLRTADFFDVEKYPDITFQSERIEKKGQQLLAVGTLTMRGVSKEIALPFTVASKVARIDLNPMTKKKRLGYATRLTLNRRDFGIYWEKAIPDFVSDEVEIEINLLVRAEP